MLSNSGVRDLEVSAGRPAAGFEVSHPFFKRTAKEILSAQACFGAKVHMPKPKSAAARMGLRFEAKVLAELSRRYPRTFCSGVPFSFTELSVNGTYSRPSTAIPDGLLLAPNSRALCIVEIKLRHTGDAWHQLNRFYLPILRKCFPRALHLRVLEICANYDPGIKLPGGTSILGDVEDIWDTPTSTHPVLLWDRR